MIIANDELLNIRGGLSISGSLIGAFAKGLEVIFNIGRSLGTSIYMIVNKKKC